MNHAPNTKAGQRHISKIHYHGTLRTTAIALATLLQFTHMDEKTHQQCTFPKPSLPLRPYLRAVADDGVADGAGLDLGGRQEARAGVDGALRVVELKLGGLRCRRHGVRASLQDPAVV